MSLVISDYDTERKVKRAISQMNNIRPTEKEFLSRAVNSYIDTLVKERIIRSI